MATNWKLPLQSRRCLTEGRLFVEDADGRIVCELNTVDFNGVSAQSHMRAIIEAVNATMKKPAGVDSD